MSHEGVGNNGYIPTEGPNTKDPLDVTFVPPSSDSDVKIGIKPTADFLDGKPVAFYQLFRYATCVERALVVAGVLLGVGTGVCMPLFIILYGEYSSLLVDRNMEGVTSNAAPILSLFGGGRILVNGTYEERMDALMEDAAAFGISSFVLGAIQFVLGVASVAVLNYSSIKQVTRIRQKFLRSLLRQDQAWHDTKGTANIATRLTEDLNKFQDGIGEKIGIFMFLIISFVSSIIMSFIHGWKLTLVVLSCAPVIIVATAVAAKVQSSLTVKELESYGSAGAVVEEVLGAIRTVVAFGGENKEVDRYTEKLGPARAMGLKRGLYSGLGGGIMWFICYCSYGLAFWYGVSLILDDRDSEVKEYTPAILVIVLFGVLAGAMNMGLASPHLEAFAIARGAASGVYKVLEHQPGIDSMSEEGARPPSLVGDIELSNVYFQYPARPQVKVLEGLNVKIAHGQTVALVGHSGCGKSTVVQLIQRLYDPADGVVKLDGVNVKQLNVNWLRSRIGVVGQEPVLFGTTIAENIRYGAEAASDSDVEEAARLANAHDFIAKLPQGYATLVGERGAQLSGGQKQRVAIARALVRKPAILLLDEATSALDRASEAKVQQALDKASKGRTTLIVTHRLATIKTADLIVVLSSGRVVEQGTHDQLMKLEGHYHKLVVADNTAPEDVNMSRQKQENEKKNSVSAMERKLSKMDSQIKDKEQADKEDDSYHAPLGRIMALNKPEWPYILVGCIAALVVGCTLPMFAVLFGEVYRVLSIEDPEEVQTQTNLFCILFVVIGIFAGLGTFLQAYMFSIVGVRLTMRLRTTVFNSILQQEMGWFDDERNSVGALCARLAGDAASVQGATGTRVAVFLQSGATLLVGVVISMYYSWNLTLVSIISVPVVLGAVFLEARLMQGAGINEKTTLEGATKIAVEAISQVRTVASLSGEWSVVKRYEHELALSQVAGQRKTRLRGVVFSLGQAAPFMCYSLSFYYGGYLIARHGLAYEVVIKVSEALIFGAWMLGQSLAYAPNFSTARIAAGRLFQLMDRKPLIVAPQPDLNNMKNLEGDIAYKNVEFFYPTRPEVKVLRGLNLLVEPGRTVALVGASGCGKSTCVQLLQRLYDPVAGSLSFSGRDIGTSPLGSLRRGLGIVSQEPVLFDRTIAENIAYGDNERDVELHEIIAAAEKANIHSFVTSLPQGYNTRLGAKGTQLSGGQKQRIAIARALLRNPRVLLLDEATSALDTQSEKVVQAALDQAREGRTCIIIAHRLATIQHADLICVLHQGVVAESGTHAQLLALGGLYCQLHQQAATT